MPTQQKLFPLFFAKAAPKAVEEELAPNPVDGEQPPDPVGATAVPETDPSTEAKDDAARGEEGEESIVPSTESSQPTLPNKSAHAGDIIPTASSGPVYPLFDRTAPKPHNSATRAMKRKAGPKPEKPTRKPSRTNLRSQQQTDDQPKTMQVIDADSTESAPVSPPEPQLATPADIVSSSRTHIPSRSPSVEPIPAPPSSGASYSLPIIIPNNDSELEIGKQGYVNEPITIADSPTINEPIVIPDSPVVPVLPPRAAHPFFAARVAPVKAAPPKPINGVNGHHQQAEMVEAPWPIAYNQHVQRAAPSLTSSQRTFERRPRKRRRLDFDSLGRFDYVQSLLPSLAADVDRSAETSGAVNNRNATSNSLSDDGSHGPPLETFLSHPAIIRLSAPSPSPFSQNCETWMEKYRPRRASEVLGNDRHTQYLKSWLQALELHIAQTEVPDDSMASGKDKGKGKEKGPKKRVIVRAVDKKGRKRRRREDGSSDAGLDWIVDDDDDDPETEVTDEWDLEEGSASSCPNSGFVALDAPPDKGEAEFDFSARLTNTMLLSGPHGAGKTAAVYACAQELGWDVFEVYPGVGKRSGMGVVALVGGVGRNHLVHRGTGTGAGMAVESKPKKKPKEAGKKVVSAFERLLGGKSKQMEGTSSTSTLPSASGTESEPIEIDGDPPAADSGFGFLEAEPMSATTPGATPAAAKVRQSLILLEEVDVLFEEDRGFWQAVVNLVRESRRPVIMTCNDPSLVPTPDLPLQEHLWFAPPPDELALPYLQRVAEVERRPISLAQARAIWHGSRFVREEDSVWCEPVCLSLKGDMEWRGCDLRRAMNSLQWVCSGRSMPDEAIEDRAQPAQATTVQAPTPMTITSQTLAHVHVQPPAAVETKSAVVPAPSEDDQGQRDRTLRELREYSILLDRITYSNAFLARPARRILDAVEIDRYVASADDEVGHFALLKPLPAEQDDGIAAFTHDTEIAQWLEPQAGPEIFSSARLQSSRAVYQRFLLQLLTPLIPISTYLLPSPPVFTDYAPLIREMVRADDAMEAADGEVERAGVSRAGRPVRSVRLGRPASGRMAYVRWISVGEEGRRGARSTGFLE